MYKKLLFICVLLMGVQSYTICPINKVFDYSIKAGIVLGGFTYFMYHYVRILDDEPKQKEEREFIKKRLSDKDAIKPWSQKPWDAQ